MNPKLDEDFLAVGKNHQFLARSPKKSSCIKNMKIPVYLIEDKQQETTWKIHVLENII
jgi:hypothetical protein